MKKTISHILLIFVSLHLCFLAFGQSNISIKAGQNLDFDGKSFSNLLAEDSAHYYFLRTSNKGYIEFNTGDATCIEVFNKQLKLVKSITLKLNTQDKIKFLQPFALLKQVDGFLIAIKYYSVANQFVKASLLKVNESGLVDNHFIALGEIHDISLSLKDYTFFDFKPFYHNGESRYLSTLRTPPELDINERINFRILDNELKLTDERLLDFPDDILDYQFSELIIGNSNHVFFSVEIKNPYIPEKKVHQLIVYDIFSDQHKTWEFGFKEGTINKAGLYKLEANQIGFMGYFTDSSEAKKPAGLFYYIFNEYGGNLLRHKIYTLDKNEVANFDPKLLGSDSEFEHLEPQAMHVSDEGDVIMIFEYRWDKLELLRDKEGILHQQTHYKANEMIITHFDAEDQFVNLGIIPKLQNLIKENNHLGFYSVLNGRELLLIYNDHPKNLNIYEGEKLKTMKSRFEPVVATYDIKDASYIKTSVCIKKRPCIFDPSEVIRLSGNSLLFIDKGENTRLVEMVLE